MPNLNPDSIQSDLDAGHAVGEVVYLRCVVTAKSGPTGPMRQYTLAVDLANGDGVALTVGEEMLQP